MKGNMGAMVETSLFKSEIIKTDITPMEIKPVLKPVFKFDIRILRECPIHRVGKPVKKVGSPDVNRSPKGTKHIYIYYIKI